MLEFYFSYRGVLKRLRSGALGADRLVLAQVTPAGAVLDDPVKEGLLEADVVTHLFALNPFMTQDFLPLSEKLLIQSRLLEVIGSWNGRIRHRFRFTTSS